MTQHVVKQAVAERPLLGVGQRQLAKLAFASEFDLQPPLLVAEPLGWG